MKKFYLFIAIALGLSSANAQYTVLEAFGGPQLTGKFPQRNLTLLGKQLYGMTFAGGNHNLGTIFTIDTNGNGYRKLIDFSSDQGTNSMIAVGNKLYGMIEAGGGPGGGVIFSIDTDGTNFTDLHDFGAGSDGQMPRETLTLVGNTLFGTTEQGGTLGYGTVFSISTSGSNYKVLLNFNDTNGAAPICNLVPQGKHLFGTCFYGGAANSMFYGCVFRIDTSGTNDTVLHVFANTDGANPFGSVTIAGNTLFGTTEFGGSGNIGTIYSMKLNGTGFKTIYGGSFDAEKFTGDPIIIGNRLYDMSPAGGVTGAGTVFSIDTNGSAFTTILSFSGNSGSDPGANPFGGLTMGGGTFYGMTNSGGANDSGVVFKLRAGPASVNEITDIKNSILAYPNPSNGKFTIQLANSHQLTANSHIEIYNLLGEKVLSENLPEGPVFNNIDISSAPAGTYFYRVTSETGALLGEGKLVKEKY